MDVQQLIEDMCYTLGGRKYGVGKYLAINAYDYSDKTNKLKYMSEVLTDS